MKKPIIVLLLLVSLGVIGQEQKTEPQPRYIKAPKFGKGILNFKGEDDSWSLKFGARMQLLSANNWFYDDGALKGHTASALVRRYRLKFDGYVYDPTVKYKLELGLSNHDLSGDHISTKGAPRLVLDAVVMWNFAGNFEVWFGQTKLPGNIERVISSANLQLVDRSRVNGEFTLDREFGIQLRHFHNITDKFVVRERLAVAQGEGRNITINNTGGHHYMGRIELLPFGLFEKKGDYIGGDLAREKTPKLMLSSTYSYNFDARKNRGSQGLYFEDIDPAYKGVTTDVRTFFVDAMFKYKGFSFMGEYADRSADNMLVRVGDGINLMSGYLFKSNWEVAGRFTNIFLDSRENRNEYTLGVSRYVVGHKLKIQSDITYSDVKSFSTGSNVERVGFRVQVEMHL